MGKEYKMSWGLVVSFFEVAIAIGAGCGLGAAIAAWVIKASFLP